MKAYYYTFQTFKIEGVMEAGKRDISEIFNRGRNLQIPFFQRSYVWDIEQWDRFLEDMYYISSSDQDYFLGSVILKQQPTGSNKDDIRTLIDGQQRLTTLNIFFKTLCLLTDEDFLFTDTFKKRRDQSVILIHNHNDINSFNRILNLTALEEVNDKNDQILKCYNFFKQNIDIARVSAYNLLDRITFVGIDLDAEENEQQIFDTINSLGVRLTTAELLKNLLFNADEINLYDEFWRNVFEKDEETINYWNTEVGKDKRSFIDVLLYSYLQIKAQENHLNISSNDISSFAIQANLFNSYKMLMKKYLNGDKQLLLEDLKEYAHIFKENFDPNIREKEISASPSMDRINLIAFELDTAVIIPFILYVIKNAPTESEKLKVFESIETFIIRRMVAIQGDVSKTYKGLFTHLINKKISTSDAFLKHIQLSADQRVGLPNDSELLGGFLSKKITNVQARGVLYLLESKVRDSSKHSTSLYGIEKYSVEHIMPKKWQNHWPATTQAEIRNRKIQTLGNLAIIPLKLNSSLKDSDWVTKKIGNGKSKGLLHYAQGLESLTKYLHNPQWNEDTIEHRAHELHSLAVNCWSID